MTRQLESDAVDDARITAAMRSFAESFGSGEETWDLVVDGGDALPHPMARVPRRRHRLLVAAAVVAGAALVSGAGLQMADDAPRDVAATASSFPVEPEPTTFPEPSSSVATTAPSTTSSVPDVRDMDIPDGKVPVADHEGGIAGFIDEEASASPEGYPALDLPSQAEVRGLPVTDANGVLVGYFVEAFGFVERAVAEAPGGIDQLIADREAEIEDLPPEIQAQIDEIQGS